MEGIIYRRAIQTSLTARSVMLSQKSKLAVLPAARAYSSMPTVAQASFWRSLIPKPWRPKEKRPDVNFGPAKTLKKAKKDWNPATFYIVIFLFIGSMSIQMISLKKDFDTHMRRAETKIGILREVVEKLQRGEEVDVEKALGTGDAEQEKEWEKVLREIEQDEGIRNSKKADRSKQTSNANTEPKSAPKNQQGATDGTTKSSTDTYTGFY
ncbi:mitochondrial metal transporter [Pestalotiopsis sp. IQ-011]